MPCAELFDLASPPRASRAARTVDNGQGSEYTWHLGEAGGRNQGYKCEACMAGEDQRVDRDQ